MTWFITGGETDFQRTSFLDEEISLEELGQNQWTAPSADEHPEGSASIYLVLQDERGGVTWRTLNFTLTER